MSRKSKAAEFVDDVYKIHVTGRNVLVTEAMKNYAIEKVGKIERFTSKIIDIYITMDIQKLEHRVDIMMNVGHLKIKSSSHSSDMYASIDLAVHKLERQLRRYKKKIQDHQARGVSMVDMNVNVLRLHRDDEIADVNDQIEDENRKKLIESYAPHDVVSNKTIKLKTLTDDEAIMKMELSQDNFLVYRQEKDQKIKVIYRLDDDNYGIIEPE